MCECTRKQIKPLTEEKSSLSHNRMTAKRAVKAEDAKKVKENEEIGHEQGMVASELAN